MYQYFVFFAMYIFLQGKLYPRKLGNIKSLSILMYEPTGHIIDNIPMTIENCISLASNPEAISIKLVIADEVDFDWASQVQQRYPKHKYYLQPCNLSGEESTIEQGLAGTRELIDRVVASGWHEATVLPQLHNLLWGNTRGV